MNIELSQFQAHALAEVFAGVILHHVRTRRLDMVGDWPKWDARESVYLEVQAAIRSVPDNGTYFSQRRDFVKLIRYHFRRLREEQRFEVRGRDWLKKVREAERKAAA